MCDIFVLTLLCCAQFMYEVNGISYRCPSLVKVMPYLPDVVYSRCPRTRLRKINVEALASIK